MPSSGSDVAAMLIRGIPMLMLTHLPKTSVSMGGGAGEVVAGGAGAIEELGGATEVGAGSIEEMGAIVESGGATEVGAGSVEEIRSAAVVAGSAVEVSALAMPTMQPAARSTMSTTLKFEMKLRKKLLQASSLTFCRRLIMRGYFVPVALANERWQPLVI
jgi:hypothetical protein